MVPIVPNGPNRPGAPCKPSVRGVASGSAPPRPPARLPGQGGWRPVLSAPEPSRFIGSGRLVSDAAERHHTRPVRAPRGRFARPGTRARQPRAHPCVARVRQRGPPQPVSARRRRAHARRWRQSTRGVHRRRRGIRPPGQLNPRHDSVVRVEARRLREKLRDYYDGGGVDDQVPIRLPKGGYHPVFEWNRPPVPQAADAGRLDSGTPPAASTATVRESRAGCRGPGRCMRASSWPSARPSGVSRGGRERRRARRL